MMKNFVPILCGIAGIAQMASADNWSYNFDMVSPEGIQQGLGWGDPNWTQNSVGLNGSSPGNFYRYANHGLANPAAPNSDTTDYWKSLGSFDYNVKYAGANIKGAPGDDFQSTGVWVDGQDLSAVNASATLKIGWAPFATFNVGTGSTFTPSSDNQLFQIGLISSTSGRFGDGATDSLFLGGLEQTYRRLATSNGSRSSTDLDLNIYDESGIVTTVAAGKEFLTKDSTNGAFPLGSDVYWYANTITYTNMGSGNMKIDWDIHRYRYDDNHTAPDTAVTTVIGESTAFASYSTTVAHGLSTASLADLHPALGMYVEDSDDISVSGTNYDYWETFASPEPSGAMLLSLSLGLLTLRRRKTAGA